MLQTGASTPVQGWSLHYIIGKGDWKHKKEKHDTHVWLNTFAVDSELKA